MARTNPTRSSTTPPQLTPLTQRGEKGEDPKGIALEQRKEGKRSNYREEIPEGVRKKIRKELDKEDRGMLNIRKKAQES